MESRQKPHMYKTKRKYKLLALWCQVYAYITSSFRLGNFKRLTFLHKLLSLKELNNCI